MIVARHVHAARLLLAFALLKVKLVCMRKATTFALFRTTRVVETDQIKRSRLLDSQPSKRRHEEVVDAPQQLVDRPLRPVDDLRVELLDDEFKRIAVFAAHLFARGDATPFRLEGAYKVANAAADSLRSEADSNETEHSEHVFPKCIAQVENGGCNIGRAVLVAPVNSMFETRIMSVARHARVVGKY